MGAAPIDHWARVAESYYSDGVGYVGVFREKRSGRWKVTAAPLGIAGYQEFPSDQGVAALDLYEKWMGKVALLLCKAVL